jgi:hypothetical protein
MAQVLAGFAADHQMFFFTGSSHTRELLRAAAPDVALRTLGA